MKIDRYTKIVLTIIAATLVWIAGQNTFYVKNVNAQSGIMKVALCDVNGFRCAGIFNDGYKRNGEFNNGILTFSR
jgi:hypothetical protein